MKKYTFDDIHKQFPEYMYLLEVWDEAHDNVIDDDEIDGENLEELEAEFKKAYRKLTDGYDSKTHDFLLTVLEDEDDDEAEMEYNIFEIDDEIFFTEWDDEDE
jgi:hypothetical protein